MGKLNEIQEQTTQSWGDNSFTTKITNDTVEFDSARDSFTFKDEVKVPSLAINGQTSQPFTSEEKTKLSQVTTPMNMAGRVDSASGLPTEDVQVGDVYLVGLSGSDTFEEYVCTALADVSFVSTTSSLKTGVDFSYASSLTKASITNILNAIDLTSASTNRNLVLSTNAQTIINADTDLTAKVTAAITAGWSIIYQTR